MDHRPIDPSGGDDDLQFDNTLRPQSLAEMLGQEKTKQQLGIAIEAARQRAARLWITCCCTVRPVWARRRFRM